jgi:hypothetical protein
LAVVGVLVVVVMVAVLSRPAAEAGGDQGVPEQLPPRVAEDLRELNEAVNG